MRHSKLEAASLEEKLKLAVLAAVEPEGPAVMAVSGGVVSGVLTVHVREAGVASVFPAKSMARTWKVCVPGARPVNALGELHDPYAAPSRRQE